MFAADVYLIGAQKSGTTFLASRLGRSPEVCLSDPKEPQFFSLHYQKGFDAYRRTFRDPGARLKVDASTTYTFLRPAHRLSDGDAPGLTAPVPQRIREVAPHARLVYVMRDPVERAMSAWRHIHRGERAPDGPLSLPDVLDADPMLELVGRYADQIERYLAEFPPERFLFLRFEDLTLRAPEVLTRLAHFLDLDEAPLLEPQQTDETHAAHGLSVAGRLAKKVPGVREAVRRRLPPAVRSRIADLVLRRPAPKVAFTGHDTAAERFASDRRRVMELTGLAV
ncbi:sulfotransferase [Silicimonas algicola]|uniref:Sulfotransferase domain-containing protein n=1 Tax=Silicimonas algicola TaxID=1826607 RepID=A0A316GD54_9RHOB|nr:sulfotransferase [Silicimonas algicola]AZQ66568.1 sulfotransferase [Silicimonas algicola]PWK58909.1 sulfotransferase domain-containing protein [Silicimonas algicola]